MAMVLLAVLIVPLVTGVQSASRKGRRGQGRGHRCFRFDRGIRGGKSLGVGRCGIVGLVAARDPPSTYRRKGWRRRKRRRRRLLPVFGLTAGSWANGHRTMMARSRWGHPLGPMSSAANWWFECEGVEESGDHHGGWSCRQPTACPCSSDSVGGGMSGETVAHVPALANPALRSRGQTLRPRRLPRVCLSFFLLPAPARVGSTWTGGDNHGRRRTGRGLDVYF